MRKNDRLRTLRPWVNGLLASFTFAARSVRVAWGVVVLGLAVSASTYAAQAREPAGPMEVLSRLAHHGDLSPVELSLADVGAVRPSVVKRAGMGEQLADNLALLFDRFGRSEFIVCLEGDVTAHGELSLRDFRMPHIAYSEPTRAGLHPDGTCGQYENIVGTLHNHPPRYPDDRDREWANCYLSKTDIRSWLEHSDYPYIFVMCAPGIWAWWRRDQVDPSREVALPMGGQIYGRERPGGDGHVK